ncbi:Zinc finger C2H2 type family protein [Brugia pahangi]
MKTKSRNEYVAHKKTHPKPFIYECKVFGCGRTFDNAASLCTHMQTHRPKPQCRDCGKFFTYMNNLYTHRKSCAKVSHKKNYECPHVGCTMKTDHHSEYIAHRRTHPKPFIYECRVPGCGRTFSNPSTFVNHQEIHGPRSHCGNCGKIFNYRKNLSPHRQCCTKAPYKGNYECPHVGCTMETRNYNEYIAHKKTHPKPFIYECRMPGCGLTFNHPSTFYGHQKRHGPEIQCGNCGKVFTCKNNLYTHKKYCTKALR